MTVPHSAWKPRQRGNPGGRPKDVGHVRELARRHTPEAIETLAAIMRNSKSDTSRVAAAQALLNRAWGHPTVSLSGTDGGGPVEHAVRIYLPDNGRDRPKSVESSAVAEFPQASQEAEPLQALVSLPDNGRSGSR